MHHLSPEVTGGRACDTDGQAGLGRPPLTGTLGFEVLGFLGKNLKKKKKNEAPSLL